MYRIALVALMLVIGTSCYAFDGDSLIPTQGSINAYFAHSGPVRPSLTFTWDVGQPFNALGTEWQFYIDGMIVSGDYGIGLSTNATSIADVLQFDKWLYKMVPLEPIVDRIAVGGSIVGTGDKYFTDYGVYVRLKLTEKVW